MERRSDLEFLLLSEDSSAQWPRVQHALVRLLLAAVDPEAALERVAFDPPPEGPLRSALRANRWKQRKKSGPIDEHFRLLLRALANHLARSNGFCSFHFDGDRPWAERESSANVADFDELVRHPLRQYLRAWLEGRGVEKADEAVERMLSRLLPLTPYYSIEAWLFQNVEALRAACSSRPAGVSVEDCHARCAEWAADRGALDEVAQVKERVCVRDTANEQLASTLSRALFAEVLAAQKSLHAARESWSASETLRGSLAALRR